MQDFYNQLSYNYYAPIFSKVFVYFVFMLSIIFSFYYLHRDEIIIRNNSRWSSLFLGLLITAFIILLFTFYPIEWGTYADREGYLSMFQNLYNYDFSDIGWKLIYIVINYFSSDYIFFFLCLSLLYVGVRYLSCYYICKTNSFLLFLMLVSSYLFLSYGVNTIRSGVASSFVLLSLSFLNKENKHVLLSVLFAFLSIGIHKSMAITIGALCFSLIYPNPKFYIKIWIISFFISFFIGSTVSSVLGEFVAENAGSRAGGYITSEDSTIYKRGFRIDFIIYSLLPIIIGYYYIYKKGFYDRYYMVLLSTYIIANVFFVLVIRANYIDRFAYLSWFLMPIILLFPLLQERKIFQNQNIIIAFILLSNATFTLLMSFKT